MSGWTRSTLAEVVTLQRGHDLPATSRGHGLVPVIGSSGVTGFHDVAKYKGPGVAIGRSGASIGVATYVEDGYWPLNTTLFVNDFKQNDPKWTYYLLDSIDFVTFNSGSVQPSLNRNYLANIEVDLPPIVEQRAIASTLGAIDDKIESNRRATSAGESLIRAVVEFALDTSEGGNGVLHDYCTLVKAPVKVEAINSGDNYIGLEHMPRGSVFLTDWEKAEGLGSNKTAFQRGDLLFGKLRPYFKKVGIAPISGVCSTDILVVRPKDPRDLALVAAVAASEELIDSLAAGSTGTRMPRASWKDLAAWPVPVLTATERDQLSARVDPLVERLAQLTFESHRLVSLRDALLPELLSGRLITPAAL